MNVDGSVHGQTFVPTDVNTYTISPSSSLNFLTQGATDLTAASFTQDSDPKGTLAWNTSSGLWMSPDGWFICTSGTYAGDRLYGANLLGTAYDVSTQTYDWNDYQNMQNWSSGTPRSACVFNWTTDTGGSRSGGGGTKYMAYYDSGTYGFGLHTFTNTSSGNTWYTYDGSSTPSYSSSSTDYNSLENDGWGLHLDASNGRAFITGRQHNKMYALLNGSGAEASTFPATFSNEFDISSQTTSSKDISLTEDGKFVIVCDDASNVYGYELSSAWDLSTASYHGTFSTSAQTSDIAGCHISPDGNTVYILDNQYAAEYENFTFGYDVSGAASGTGRVAIFE